jgi:hypothetical protein
MKMAQGKIVTARSSEVCLTVATYIRRQWLRDSQRLLIPATSVELGKTSKKSFGVSPQAFRAADRFTVHCRLVRSGAPGQRSETQLTFAARDSR